MKMKGYGRAIRGSGPYLVLRFLVYPRLLIRPPSQAGSNWFMTCMLMSKPWFRGVGRSCPSLLGPCRACLASPKSMATREKGRLPACKVININMYINMNTNTNINTNANTNINTIHVSIPTLCSS